MQPNTYEYGDQRHMNVVQTAAYHPPTMYKPSFMQMGLPPFTLEVVEWMRRDPQVRLGMSIKLAPFHVVKLTIKGDPNIATFMGNMIHRFWMRAIPKVLRAFWYTRSGGEIVYELRNGRQEFRNYHDVYPSDVGVLTRDRVPVGISIRPQAGNNDAHSYNIQFSSVESPMGTNQPFKPLRLLFPKGFLYLHNREFGSFHGQSEFEAAYEAWMEKCDTQGGKHSRKLWFYKNAFSGGILFHPPGTYRDENNNEVPYQALARQALETSLNGSVWTFEQKFDPTTGHPFWAYVEPKLNGSGKDLLDYIRNLDNEIMRGIGIPDDVVQQISGTGSYAGRSVPLMGFFISQRTTLTSMFTVCDEQVFRPLCRANFGHDNYEATMEIDIERLMGAMDGNPNTPSINEAAFENPHANPQGLPTQQAAANKTSQFSEIPDTPSLIAVPTEAKYSEPAKMYNGTWDDSVRLVLNPQNRSTVYQFAAQQQPAGTSHTNRTGKTSTGGMFTEGPGPETTDSKKKVVDDDEWVGMDSSSSVPVIGPPAVSKTDTSTTPTGSRRPGANLKTHDVQIVPKTEPLPQRVQDLPQLRSGYIRVVHRGSPVSEDSIRHQGLDYSKQGMLMSTASTHTNDNDFATDDERFKNGHAYVFDIPEEELKNHNDVSRSPGVVPPQYLVGILPPDEWNSKNRKKPS